ncbi:MAG: T9SS type A sorting domain-containing protein [Crocinitomicaceae bacterium]|nr:T9SS type A sorting domain-containing protein [Crocinitomicaceae bacterium]
MKIIISLFLLLALKLCFAQQTANYVNNWYLGTGAGISFNSGTPVNIPSNIASYEVTTSISDGDGNTLFYVGAPDGATSFGNGFTVWDGSNMLMPNGDVAVGFSQSCGLTAVPVPGNCDQYYIFALTALGGTDYGLRYSIVDMSLPGNGTIASPLGDIDPIEKDILVFASDTLAEKIKVVQKGNTENFWVITRSVNNDLFYSFEVTATGVNSIPVVSVISPTNWPTSIGSPVFSWIAVNKNRDMIAEANGFGPDVKLFNFDNQTGILSLAEVLIPTGTFGSDIPYGIEFSPSGNVLYASWFTGGNTTYISSFDITAGAGSIAGTRQDFLVGINTTAEYSGLTKAPDGKIYGSRNGYTHMITLETPENYLNPNLTIPGYDPSPGSAIIGMPNLTYYYHPDNFIDTLAGNDKDICPSDQAIIGVENYDSIWATYSWEPAAMVVNASNAVTQTVPLNTDQQFILSAITDCGDTIKTDTVVVTVDCGLLPVELTNFNARKSNESSLLTWETISEINNDKFIIQHSLDAHHFTDVGEVKGSGNSQQLLDYLWIHDRPFDGTNYYRLKQVDFDGAYEYSEIRIVQFAPSKLNVYPNPVIDRIQVAGNLKIKSVVVYNSIGQIVKDKDFNESFKAQLETKSLASGYYLIEVKTIKDGNYQFRIFKN